MINKNIQDSKNKPLRLWPGIVIAIVVLVIRFIFPILRPEDMMVSVIGGMFGFFAILAWWAFLSRAPRFDRFGAILLIIISLVITIFIIDKSMRLLPLVGFIIPVLSLGFVISAVVAGRLKIKVRRIAMAITILVLCCMWALIKTGGITGDITADFTWRWFKTPEDLLLAQSQDQLTSFSPDQKMLQTDPEWPGFRGPERDGIIRNIKIKTDWKQSPPGELWRHPVGPGWSSFAAHGELIYTQEQRGEHETVSCYNITNGKPVWRYTDEARFWESNSGAGPRATPTVFKSRVFTLGGTGILNALNAFDGTLIWSRNAAEYTGTKIPTWGFSGSPLVVGNIVIAAAGGSLIACDINNGEVRWSHNFKGDCYSSPHLMNIDNVTQVLLQNHSGTFSVLPEDGSILWEYSWPGQPSVQPTFIEKNDILVSSDEKSGVRRISLLHNSGKWSVKELWTSTRIKPYFNDTVVLNGYAYGFFGSSLCCIDLKDGSRKWRGGSYGRGQVILFAEQGLILVLSERGELALVDTAPEKFAEIIKIPAIKGKTWNHPVIVGDILLIRNAEEMAAFKVLPG